MAKRIDSSYNYNEETLQSVNDFLSLDEHIIHRMTPRKSAFVMNHVFKNIFFVLIWLAFDSVFITTFIYFKPFEEIPWILAIIIPFFLVHLFPVWSWIAGIIKSIVNHKKYETVFTNEKVIMKRPQRRGKEPVFHLLRYADIQSMSARSGLIDKVFKVGDIHLQSSRATYLIEDVPQHKAMLSALNNLVRSGGTEVEEDPFEAALRR